MSCVCLVWYVVCRGRMYVVRCLVGVSSLRFLLYKEVGSRWKSQRDPLRKSLGQCGALHFVTSRYYPSIPCHRQHLLLVLQ